MVHTHPTVLERLQAEVKEVLGEETNITKELLQKLEYTEQVLLETLRMHPPVPGIAKEVAPEGLDVGGYHVPGGTSLILPSSVLCRMPEYFDEPDTFNPDRFSPQNTQPSSFVFFPFGLGHRSCIGKHFALMEAKMILARLIQTYQVTLPSGYQLVRVQRTTMQPQDTVNCTIQLC
ncbi:cholesterol 24-hydroxylase-like [Halichondria panicea]|uniref:cholesterol 24-hydroxylase-like n=1 Tax=Halichondria panicea TaxID=6063 RepID=UPI00312B7359